MQACETEIEESSMQGAHSFSHRAPVPQLPLQWIDLGRMSSLHLFPQAEQLPQWSALLHILHPRNGHSSDPLISLHISLHFIHSFYVFSQSCILTPSVCWVVNSPKYLEVCRHFIIPQKLGDQLFRLKNVIWKTIQRDVSDDLLSFRTRHIFILSSFHIHFEIQMPWIWDISFSEHFQYVLFLRFRYTVSFLLACKNVTHVTHAYKCDIENILFLLHSKKKQYLASSPLDF